MYGEGKIGGGGNICGDGNMYGGGIGGGGIMILEFTDPISI
jgi:hypothetical protein